MRNNNTLFAGFAFVFLISILANSPRNNVPSNHTVQKTDADGDGVPDAVEDSFARHFAPIIYHDPNETTFPTTVDRYLQWSELFFYDDACTPDINERVGRVDEHQLSSQYRGETACTKQGVSSGGTRSRQKQHTFYLKDVDDEHKTGDTDSTHWATYYHVYPNLLHGLTVQYWRLYAFNSLAPVHGGDWEGFHLVTDRKGLPVVINLVGHRNLEHRSVDAIEWQQDESGRHPVLFAQIGGHTTAERGNKGRRHPTWLVGPFINVGEKAHPLNGQEFIRYSGLWGSPGVLYYTGGYWGPAFNETDMTSGYISAWCNSAAFRDFDSFKRECFPENESR